MDYHPNFLKFLFSPNDHLFRMNKAEQMKPFWKSNVLLVLLGMFLYLGMALLGIGSELISQDAVLLGELDYESSKLWFAVGRLLYGLLFGLFILFVPAYLYNLLTDIPYKKLVIMQQIVLFVLLIERLLWIPLIYFAGLDWYVSPFSFGIIASYITEHTWLIYFFGAISIFQLWIMYFQVHCLSYMSTTLKKGWLWVSVIFLHLLGWGFAATISFVDQYIISGWFG